MDTPTNGPKWFSGQQSQDLLAKSADRTPDKKPESLAKHTWLVLKRLSEFIKLRPRLPQEMDFPRLWQVLYWSAFLHDFGKAADGFQSMLRSNGNEKWLYRHEVLSLAFVDWIDDDFSEEEKKLMIATIVSHHRDISLILENYESPSEPNPFDPDNVSVIVSQLSEASLSTLWDWLEEYGFLWANELEISQETLSEIGVQPISLISKAEAIDHLRYKAVDRIYEAIDSYDGLHCELKRNPEKYHTIVNVAITLRGYLTNADHCASSHYGELPSVKISAEQILASRNIPRQSLHGHQRLSEKVIGSTLLTAPTGSGKTEAALLWAANQVANSGNTPRLFYTLPYQASMNAMKTRLDGAFGKSENGQDLVGLQHGRSSLAYYRRMMDEAEDRKSVV